MHEIFSGSVGVGRNTRLVTAVGKLLLSLIGIAQDTNRGTIISLTTSKLL